MRYDITGANIFRPGKDVKLLMNDSDPGGPLIRIAAAQPLSFWLGAGLAALVFLLLYAFSVALEAAIPALRREQADPEAARHEEKRSALNGLLQDRCRLNHHVGFLKLFFLFCASSALGCLIWQGVLPWLRFRAFPFPELAAVLFALLAIVLLAAVCTEFPSRMVRSGAEGFERRALPLFKFLSFFLLPLSALSVKISSALLRSSGVGREEEGLSSEGELRERLNLESEIGAIPHEEQRLIENVFNFGDKTVEECMTHRVDLVAVELHTELPELLALLQEEKFTRIPVYENDIDHICGFFHSRDLLLRVAQGKSENFSLSQLLRECSYTPESTQISSLFRQMQRQHSHMSVVIDEYGGTAGIITMEDLLEEIVGQIQDEYDEEEPEIQAVGQDAWICEGSTSLEDLQKVVGLSLPEEDYDTLAGFFIDLLDRIPGEDEQPEAVYGGLLLKVLEMNEKRIEKVLLRRLPGNGSAAADKGAYDE